MSHYGMVISFQRPADQVRAEIRRLEAAHDEATAAGLKVAALAALSALRWIVGDADRPPADVLGAK